MKTLILLAALVAPALVATLAPDVSASVIAPGAVVGTPVAPTLDSGFGELDAAYNFGGTDLDRDGIAFVGVISPGGNPVVLADAPFSVQMSSGTGSLVNASFGVDPLFETEVYPATGPPLWNNTPQRLTVDGLDPTRTYQFQLIHGDTRTADFSNWNRVVSFTDSEGNTAQTALRFGNVDGSGRPYAVIRVVASGTTSFTYELPDMARRGPSVSGLVIHSVPEAGATQGCPAPEEFVWMSTGPDATVATVANLFALSYNHGLPSEEPETTWTLTTSAPASETLLMDWAYSGNHGWFRDRVELVAFADGPDGTIYMPLVDTPDCESCPGETDGHFEFDGSVELQVFTGYEFGFMATGENFDCCSRLRGVLQVALIPTDADCDGIPDSEDKCPFSDTRLIVVVGGDDSGVPNLLLPGGCTLADIIMEIADNARNHGQFVSGVAGLLNELKREDMISGAEQGALLRTCAKFSDLSDPETVSP